MAEPKTRMNNASVVEAIRAVPDEQRRKDGLALLKLFKEVTGVKPKMWGTSIVGFGSYHYKSDRSAQEGDWPLTGFSPRKQALTVYLMSGTKQHAVLLKKLGKHKTSGGSCVYIKKLEDVDVKVLAQLIKESFEVMKKKYKES